MTDPTILGTVAATFVVAVYTGIKQHLEANQKKLKDEADRQQAEVDRTQMNQIKKTTDDTHTLSNSAMGLALRENALAKKTIYLYAKRIADNYSKEIADIDAVTLTQAAWLAAEKLASKHEGQQETVDASGKA